MVVTLFGLKVGSQAVLSDIKNGNENFFVKVLASFLIKSDVSTSFN